MPMLHAILILLGCQLAGEVMSRGLSLPVPGPVIGMGLLFAALQMRARLRPDAPETQALPLGAVAAFLLANLSLLFVPAGVGIVRQTSVLAAHGVGLIIALVVSDRAHPGGDGAGVRGGVEAPQPDQRGRRMTEPFRLWVFLSASPLTWLTATLAAYALADWLSQRAGRHPLANPVLIAVSLLAVVLAATQTPYATYFEGAQFIHFLLGPATVALALPLHQHWRTVRQSLLPIAAALVAGGVTAVVSAVGIALAFGAPFDVIASLAPKSVTAAIAMGISQEIGGNAAGALRSASPRMASARRAPFRSTPWPAPSPASRSG
jgi:putative effector of murein hydrolase LrgA (UPF0299 family)